ncbi:hypothetical protein [Polaromonas hydrogenivorans]|uniref:Uncharacterized protein n=1 Tax=Polaromonas hydrogenivorans TaxID=335476 RepID=A0AAU7LU44_9BURK
MNGAMRLDYLAFDYSEDTEGTGVFEAVASVWPERVAAVHAEIVAVLDWAHQAFPGQRGAVGEGGEWDYDLHGLREYTVPEQIGYDAATQRLAVQAASPGKPRHTVTLLLSGTDEFCSSFRQQFALDKAA